MLSITNDNGFVYYEFVTVYYSFFSFSLVELLKSLPAEYKNKCLTQLN